MKDWISRAQEVIAVDSSSASGNREVALYLAKLAQSWGFTVRLHKEFFNNLEQFNLLIFPSKPPDQAEIMLVTHLDTLNPGPVGQWTRTGANPFRLTRFNRNLYGLGVSDAKLTFLMQLEALRTCIETWGNPNIILVGTFGGEQGGKGIIRLIRQRQLGAKYALVTHPTHSQLVEHAKGVMSFEMELSFLDDELKAQQKHDLDPLASSQSRMFWSQGKKKGSKPAFEEFLTSVRNLPEDILLLDLQGGESHQNSLQNIFLEFDTYPQLRSPIVQRLQNIDRYLQKMLTEMETYQDHRFRPSISHLHLGFIKKYSEFIRIGGMIRYLPGIPENVFSFWTNGIQEFCKKNYGRWSMRDHHLPLDTPSNFTYFEELISQATGVGGKSSIGLNLATEANVLYRFGVPSAVWGPGHRDEHNHPVNESISEEELEKAFEFYKSVFREKCL